jgi:hypothetical protein
LRIDAIEVLRIDDDVEDALVGAAGDDVERHALEIRDRLVVLGATVDVTYALVFV